MLSMSSNSKLKNVIEHRINASVLKNKEIEVKLEQEKQMKSMMQDKISFMKTIADNYYSSLAIIQDIEKLLQEQTVASRRLQKVENQISLEKRKKKNIEVRDALEMAHYNLYKKNLGFFLTTVRGPSKDDKCLNLAFDNVDKKNPQKKFSFNLKTDGVSYTVTDCVPQITEMDKLLQELNRTNNLRAFILTVRRKFCAIAASNS